MNGKCSVWLSICCLVLALFAVNTAEASPPWGGVLSLTSVDADPDKSYTLTKANGPWMILACTFSGDGAEQQAQELVLELRQRYKLEAYTHERQMKFGATHGRGLDPTGRPLMMRHRIDRLREIAVMVGNFRGVDDPSAQRTLRKLKTSHPKCLEISEERQTYQSLAALRVAQRVVQRVAGSAKKDKGPMGHAFISPNPLLGDELAATSGLDPMVVEMNQHVEHSLLDCPGNFTVQVATFTGSVVIDQREIREIEQGKELESGLAEAAVKAHQLTEALRLKGWEAYEFHDRYSSIVTIGGFSSTGTPRPDGKIEINPGIHRIMTTFGARQAALPGQPAAMTMKSLIGIPFDIQPIPVHVPRRSLSREMARSVF